MAENDRWRDGTIRVPWTLTWWVWSCVKLPRAFTSELGPERVLAERSAGLKRAVHVAVDGRGHLVGGGARQALARVEQLRRAREVVSARPGDAVEHHAGELSVLGGSTEADELNLTDDALDRYTAPYEN